MNLSHRTARHSERRSRHSKGADASRLDRAKDVAGRYGRADAHRAHELTTRVRRQAINEDVSEATEQPTTKPLPAASTG